ncbi:MAG: marine proteobacterial sortase target protein [Thermoanaerobaculia bacterium]
MRTERQPLLTVPESPNDYTLEKWIAVLLAILFLLPLAASASEVPLVRLDQVGAGTLLAKTARPGVFAPLPALETRADVTVRGIVARTVLRQSFENGFDECIEAIYALPVPEDAAVDTMRVVVGVRTIEGEIREREEARQVYEQAKSEGRKASLLEQERPNLFTVAVASVAPGERVEVQIEYQQKVRWDSGRFSLRIPSTLAPRYVPETSAGGAQVKLPPLHFRGDRANALSIEIDLDAGIPLQEIRSATHPIQTTATGATRWSIRVGGGPIPADRDFELAWTPRLGREPESAYFTESVGGDTYALVMLFPPDEPVAEVALPREVIFIIDTSGSMMGPSLDQAKRALGLALGRLRPRDSFNVIEFNSVTRPLWESSRGADAAAVAEARAFVEALQSEGGTEMAPALAMALRSPRIPSTPLRQIVFITDGQVANERELFELIESDLGDARLFTVGIGSAPNAYFMRHAARRGRGTWAIVSSLDEVEERMNALFTKIESPVLSNVTIAAAPGAEVWPARVPDLFHGEPLVATMRLPAGATAHALVSGDRAGASWSRRLAPDLGGEQNGIAKLWAREKIEAVADSRSGGADLDAVRRQIVEIALAHHLVSEYTSLVAVDATPAGVDPRSCVSTPLPLNLPDGWGGSDELSVLPQTATPGRLFLLLGVLFACAAVVLRKIA